MEVRGQRREGGVVDFLVEDAGDGCQGGAGAGEDGDVVLAGADGGAEKLCCDILGALGTVWFRDDGEEEGLVG